MITLKQALKTDVFTVNEFEIEKTNLAEFIRESTDETTSPRGVESRIFFKKREYFVDKETGEETSPDHHSREYCFTNFIQSADTEAWKNNGEYYETQDSEVYVYFEIMTWGIGGHNLKSEDQFFMTEEEAEEYIFQQTYKYEFMNDDTRSTVYFENIEEAEIEVIENISYKFEIEMEVATSIYRKMKLVKKGREQQKADWLKNEAARIEELSTIYAKMIDKVDGEKYKETCRRLSGAIGEKVEKKVFHEAVKKIRR